MASRMWKDGTRRGIAYIEGREQADRVLAVVGRTTGVAQKTPSDSEKALGTAMAVYTDRKGRPFAWQIPFDITRWDELNALLNGV
ncbi:MAG: hypothetical protein SFU56_13805 [Capsulimonadales bacterium]|nr:hypothetical protein [Capsulimonadales bacterium]